MCEGATHCPSTGIDIEKAPCKVALNFGIPVLNTIDEVWEKIGETMKREEEIVKAIQNGATGFSLMMGQK